MFMKLGLIFILLLKKLQFKFYISIDVINIDDCISKIYSVKEGNNISYFILNETSFSECNYKRTNYYPNNGHPIIKNVVYNIGEKLYLEVYNLGYIDGYIDIIVNVNEFILNSNCLRKFWKCINCFGEENNYIFSDNKFYLFNTFQSIKNTSYEKSYYFYFMINNFTDLISNCSEINNDFYSLTNKRIFNRSINYKNNELELINFNTNKNFYIKDNYTLDFTYTNYNFHITFINEFYGNLVGLDIYNSEINLTNGSIFYVNETKGLKYILSQKEKKNYSAFLFLKITAFNKYLSKSVSQEEDFQFYITLVDSLRCLNEKNNSDSKNVYHYNCPHLLEEELNNSIKAEIIQRTEIDKKSEIKGNNFFINISPINSTFFNITNYKNLIDCDNILKQKYNIEKEKTITFMQILINVSNSSNETLELNYAYYDNNKLFLNLSFCIKKKEEQTYFFDPNLCYNKVYYYYDEKNRKFSACLNKSKEELIKNISQIFDDVIIGQNYEIKGEDYNIKISPTNATYLSSVSHGNFTKCEDKLREFYDIDKSRYITFMQLEINNTDKNTLINKIEYQAYDDKKKELNLSICKDINVKITHSIKNNSIFDMISANLFKDLGIDIFNINDSFFTDVCHSYSDSENDLTLKDRIKIIFQNYSLCEEGCFYDEIDLGNMTITCDCKVKTDLNVDNITINLFPYEEKDANFQIIKCYNLVFSLKGKLFNIGFWIFLFLVTAHFPLLFLYFYKGIKPIKGYIFEQMEKYGYIKKSEKSNSKNRNYSKKNSNKKRKSNTIVKFNSKKSKKKIKNAPPPKDKNDEDSRRNKLIINSRNDSRKHKSSIEGHSHNKIKKTINKKENKSINILLTQDKVKNINNDDVIKYKNKNKKEKSKNKIVNFNIINININKKKREYIPKESKQILNNYSFEEAIKYDLRSICLIYYIFLLSKQAIFHAFLFKSPLEVFSIRLCLLIFIYSSDLALNAFFYLDDKISEKYHSANGLFLFAFSNNITVILLSTFVGFLFMTLFTNLSNSSNEIRNLFRTEEEKLISNKKYFVIDKRKKEIKNEIVKILKKFQIKIIILIIIEFLLMLFFWYYVTAFCHVYNSTQYSWLFDSFLSILSRSVIDFMAPMGFAKLYRLAVESNIKCLYKVVMFFYSFA